MTAHIRVIDRGPAPTAAGARFHQFSATWADTKATLRSEVAAIARDGDWHPEVTVWRFGDAVTVTFTSRYGELALAADAYKSTPRRMPGWQANVRAVALTLEALRAVTRHGVAVSEQYAGWQQAELPAAVE